MPEAGDDVTPRDPKGGGAMKTSKFQNNLVGTTACMKRLAISTKDLVQPKTSTFSTRALI